MPLADDADAVAWADSGAMIIEGRRSTWRWRDDTLTEVCADLGWPNAVATGGDQLWVASGATVHRVDDDRCTEVFADPDDNEVRYLAASPDGRWLVAAGHKTHLVEAATGQTARTIDAYLRAATWSPDGARWAGAVDDAAVLVWEAP